MNEPKRRVSSSDTVETFLSHDGADETPNAPVKKNKVFLDRVKHRRQLLRSPAEHPHLLSNYFNVYHTTAPTPHNKSNKQFKVVLPGVPKYETDWTRDCHDFFNLICLVPVLILNALNWNWEMLYQNFDRHLIDALPSCWTGDYFEWFFYATAFYFLIDLLWIVIYPHCVKSPAVILQHHVAVLLYICIPFHYEPSHWCMGVCMSVECNTWFLIARRVFNKQGFPPWQIGLGWLSIRVKVISIFFYLTWISIRCILYPCLMGTFYRLWQERILETGSYMNILFPCVPLHACFCLLNLKWSYELLMSKIRYLRRKKQLGDVAVDLSVSKGL